MAEWLRDQTNAEPCAAYPRDASAADGPGGFAFHADDLARDQIVPTLGEVAGPLYVDQAAPRSGGRRVASGATLGAAVARMHLRGSTADSSFRRSVAALLWRQLDLRCDAPKRLDAASNARLTAWMLEHLQVA